MSTLGNKITTEGFGIARTKQYFEVQDEYEAEDDEGIGLICFTSGKPSRLIFQKCLRIYSVHRFCVGHMLIKI